MNKLQNISPPNPGVKKYRARFSSKMWDKIFPMILKYLDFESLLSANNVCKSWKNLISPQYIVVQAGYYVFGRENFYDKEKLRTSSLHIYHSITSKTSKSGNGEAGIRCIDFIDSVIMRWRVSYATFELATNVAIEFLARIQMKRTDYSSMEELLKYNHQLLGAASILIASKIRDVTPLKITQIITGHTKALRPSDIVLAEEYVLSVLPNWVEIDQVNNFSTSKLTTVLTPFVV